VIHVTFSSSGAGSLRQALGLLDQRRKVVDLTDDLSWGPITRGDFVAREAWLNLNLPCDTQPPLDHNYWDWIETGAQSFQKKLKSSDEHLVWVAPQNAQELCGLLWYLDRWSGHNATFILVEHGLPGAWQGEVPKGIGELGPEQFQFLLGNADRNSWDIQRFPQARWAQLCDEASNLRIVNQGMATSVREDYFDDIFLGQCSDKWQKLYRVVAGGMIALWEAQHHVGDSFILWRLRELESQGKVIASRSIKMDYSGVDDPILVRLN
jgi:Protein of unknown function/Domain of unknown function (DUF1835)